MGRKQVFRFAWALAVAGAVAGAALARDPKEAHDLYADPKAWDGTCSSGKNQSPINLTGFIKAELPPLSLSYAGGASGVFWNNGHTVQVNYAATGAKGEPAGLPPTSGHTLALDGRAFDLKQFHFHAPSENQIDGEAFAMEAHFVHKSDDDLAVVAVMLKLGPENAKLGSLWQSLPAKGGDQAAVTFKPTDLLPQSMDYYRFNGSLTTPPCSEGVRWLVLKTPVSISEAQVEAFMRTLPHGASGNARPLQKVNARPVLR